jgi:thioesterase domain-containing protein
VVPEEYPIYGLQAPGVSGTGELSRSIREMAAAQVEQIRAVQQTGPYCLLGWSFGGVPAHEIAVQLRAAGEQVAALVIMDAAPPRTGDDADPPVEKIGRSESDADATAWLADRIRGELGDLLNGFSKEETTRLVRVFENNRDIRRSHVPGTFDGNALLFTSVDGGVSETSYSEMWRPYIAGRISEVRLPCRHTEMVRPEMLADVWEAVAEWLRPE